MLFEVKRFALPVNLRSAFFTWPRSPTTRHSRSNCPRRIQNAPVSGAPGRTMCSSILARFLGLAPQVSRCLAYTTILQRTAQSFNGCLVVWLPWFASPAKLSTCTDASMLGQTIGRRHQPTWPTAACRGMRAQSRARLLSSSLPRACRATSFLWRGQSPSCKSRS